MTSPPPLIDTDGLVRALHHADFESLTTPLLNRTQQVLRDNRHGDWEKWHNILAQLDEITAASHDFTIATPRIGEANQSDEQTRARLKSLLLQLAPWRKGAFDLFGVIIDSEWRSDLKWARLAGKISCLRNRRVLDVGCGNGYYLWRMLGAGARLALGIDPTQLFIAQFNAIKRYCPQQSAWILPLTSEQFPPPHGVGFDSVFSMGVLSHRSDPHQHLREVLSFTRPGGELVVENLIVDGDATTVFIPEGRYAKMRNIHAIPSAATLAAWLENAGGKNIRLIDISVTTPDEQRVTEWMQFESLSDFLAADDASKTIEGHPAPKRAIFCCQRDK